jgi:outer membrane protein
VPNLAFIRIARRPIWTLALIAAGSIHAAHAEEGGSSDQYLSMGVARVNFNVSSNDLAGPAGTTPPGVRASVKDQTVYTLVYQHRIVGPWAVTFQGGWPPKVKVTAQGTAAALGQIGTARAWFPALLASYNLDTGTAFTPHVDAGLHYTAFTDGKIFSNYDAAFEGTSSRARLSRSLGPVVKVGSQWAVTRNWFLDASYNRYWIKSTANITTATPGAGDIDRQIKIRSTPDVWALSVGYRF